MKSYSRNRVYSSRRAGRNPSILLLTIPILILFWVIKQARNLK